MVGVNGSFEVQICRKSGNLECHEINISETIMPQLWFSFKENTIFGFEGKFFWLAKIPWRQLLWHKCEKVQRVEYMRIYYMGVIWLYEDQCIGC